MKTYASMKLRGYLLQKPEVSLSMNSVDLEIEVMSDKTNHALIYKVRIPNKLFHYLKDVDERDNLLIRGEPIPNDASDDYVAYINSFFLCVIRPYADSYEDLGYGRGNSAGIRR